jgi:hypothetical protein
MEVGMERADRLHMVARACYYLGWVMAIIAAIDTFAKMDKALLAATSVSGRNLLEASFLFFVISVASEVRALGATSGNNKPLTKGHAA